MDIKSLSWIMESAKRVHFIGIGGISMSSLAAITKRNGYTVSGSDRTKSALTQRLEDSGVTVTYAHLPQNVEGASLVVYTAAIHPDNPELKEAIDRGIPTCSRADYLGWLMSGYTERIGVAGTHGKSTVTSMLSEIYIAAELDPTVVSGAVLREMGGAYRIGNRDNFIFEACEYCDSFLSFIPTTAVITNIEYDHADYFKDMDQLRASFVSYTKPAERTVICADDTESVSLSDRFTGQIVTYGLHGGDYSQRNMKMINGCASFDLTHKGQTVCRISLSVPGEHNALDAICASATAHSLGVDPAAIAKGLSLFGGADRRFQLMGKTQRGALVYNDYAHHPSELRATLSAAKGMGKRIVSVFQPHTYSRTAGLWDDFTKCFSDSNITVFADIYAAREENIYGVSSEALAKEVQNGLYLPSFESIAEYIKSNCDENDLVLILGAGDIIKLGAMVVK